MQRISAKNLRALMLAIAVCVFTAALSWGQGTSGSLTGLVTDPTGAVVPQASVVLTNTGTNYTQAVKTDATGVYLLKPVEPAGYSLKIEASGFAKYVQTGIEIHASQNVTQNVTLKVGSVGQTVDRALAGGSQHLRVPGTARQVGGQASSRASTRTTARRLS